MALSELVMDNQAGTGFLMSLHLLTYFKMQGYYQKEPKFNGVFSRNNLPVVPTLKAQIKNGAYE